MCKKSHNSHEITTNVYSFEIQNNFFCRLISKAPHRNRNNYNFAINLMGGADKLKRNKKLNGKVLDGINSQVGK